MAVKTGKDVKGNPFSIPGPYEATCKIVYSTANGGLECECPFVPLATMNRFSDAVALAKLLNKEFGYSDHKKESFD